MTTRDEHRADLPSAIANRLSRPRWPAVSICGSEPSQISARPSRQPGRRRAFEHEILDALLRAILALAAPIAVLVHGYRRQTLAFPSELPAQACRPRDRWYPVFMSYQTVEVELNDGRVWPRKGEALPPKAHALLTILEPSENTPRLPQPQREQACGGSSQPRTFRSPWSSSAAAWKLISSSNDAGRHPRWRAAAH